MLNKSSSNNTEAIISYWLGSSDSNPARFEAQQKLWYHAKPETDNHIRMSFETDLVSAENGSLFHWGNTAEGSLALVILLDQFSRNLYRGTPAAYSNDVKAQDVVVSLLDRDGHLGFNVPAQIIFYHPLHHAENLIFQRKAVSLFEEMLEHASDEWRKSISKNLTFIKNHCDIISNFGRFPHRNTMLGRHSTPEEHRYLQRDKRTYGQQ